MTATDPETFRNSYFALSAPEREALAAWLEYAIESAEEIGVDSWRLRQDFQSAAFHVTDEAMRHALRRAGYEAIDPTATCWKYRARLRFPRRGTTWWKLLPEDKPRWRAFRAALDEAFMLKLP